MTDVEKCIKRIKCTHAYIKRTSEENRYFINANNTTSFYMTFGYPNISNGSIAAIFDTLSNTEQEQVRNADHGCKIYRGTIDYPL